VAERDPQDVALHLAESASGHTGVGVLISAGQGGPKPGKEKEDGLI